MRYEAIVTEINTLLEQMNIDMKDLSVVRDDDIDMLICSLSLRFADAELFLEDNEAVLRSLSSIARLFLTKKQDLKANILFDVNHHQIDFINQAKEKARIAKERVEFFKKDYEFGYLSGYERMIIHSYLKKQKGIQTFSEGEGKDRRLIIKHQE